jgi:hypothetical protein
MDWTTYAVPRLGGAILESFNTDTLLTLTPEARSQQVTSIAGKIVRAILAADVVVKSRRDAVQDGCSSTGCVMSDTY